MASPQPELPDMRAIFAEALERTTPEEQAAFLEQACQGNAELRARVEGLLRAHREAGSFLQEPTTPRAATIDEPKLNEGPGTVIGPYKLLEQIGEGGMGVVYLAEQKEPLRRTVALKVIKPGMDTRQVVARFEAERQALALMNHPNIARVLDAGATETGRPYFVMELVKGTPITQFSDQQHLNPRERLQLFISVCQAVQHAHQKGLIHRDLKPSNLLVEMHDVTPVPKVIDFGVAKAMGQQLTEKSLHTGFTQMVGTPLYMSPEQAGQSSIDVDTRSDIYSLGVLLYELLTGTTPFDKETLTKVGYDELRRIIREDDPPRPSARVGTLPPQVLSTVSDCRKTEPRKLSQQLRSELDWIVMKSLEKDRARRYETASGLAADVNRYLCGEAVQAHPPSTAYRMKKFVRRHKGQVIAASLVLLALVAGVLGTSLGLLEARRQAAFARAQEAEARKQEGLAREEAAAKERARNAEAEERTKAEAAKVAAQAKEAEANAVVRFFEDNVFAAARPSGRGGELGAGVTLQKAIVASLPALDKGFAEQPLVEARLRMALGITFMDLAEHDQARDQFERARALCTRHHGPDHPNTLASMHNLANVYERLGRHDDALKLRDETLTLTKAKLGPDHLDTLMSIHGLANSYAALGRHVDAQKLYEETLALLKVKVGPDHPATLVTMQNLSNVYHTVGRHDDALKLREETLALRKANFGPDHPATLMTMHDLADSYADLGRYDDALKLREETLALRKVRLGPEHHDTLASMHNLAYFYAELGRHADALKLGKETLALQKAKLGPDHPHTLLCMDILVRPYKVLGRYDDALKLCEESLVLRKAKLGPDHPDTLFSMNRLARLLATCPDLKLRDAGRAVELAKKAVELDPQSIRAWQTLGWAQYRAGDWQASIQALEKSCALEKGGDCWQWIVLALSHGRLAGREGLLEQERVQHQAQARRWYDQAVEWMEKNHPMDEELRRFRAEAEELLGVKDESKPEKTPLPKPGGD